MIEGTIPNQLQSSVPPTIPDLISNHNFESGEHWEYCFFISFFRIYMWTAPRFRKGLPTSPRNPFGKLTFYVWLFVVDYRFTDSQSTWHFVIYHSITVYAQLLAGFTLCCNQLPTSVLNLIKTSFLTTPTLLPRGRGVHHQEIDLIPYIPDLRGVKVITIAKGTIHPLPVGRGILDPLNLRS
jgi:hypothetical protein